MDRIQKLIAESGHCSRRKAEELIKEGKVTLNGKVVTELGTKASSSDTICVSGKIIKKVEEKIYLCMNKPSGILCTLDDPLKRKTIIDILPVEYKDLHLYSVGRLDYDTKGVILLTNDGSFMNDIAGPKSGIEKVYNARVDGILSFKDVKDLSSGIVIDGKKTLPSIVNVISTDNLHNSTLVEITITFGQYHIVKKMFDSIGHPVKSLKRVRYGCITLDNLPTGSVRKLSVHEVKTLYALSKQNKDINKRG